MPQMAPISWLSLFIVFSLSFLIFNMMNFYIFKPSMPKSNISNKSEINYKLNWKW